MMRLNLTKTTFLCAAGILGVSLAPAQAEDRALIIGIGDYAHEEVGDLPSPAQDAQRFTQFVIDELDFDPSAVVTLVDEQATAETIIAAVIQHLIQGTEAGDRVVFYFAGHGGRVPDSNGDEEDEFDEIIMLHDAGTRQHGSNGLLLDDELDQLFALLNDRRTMLVFDSCYSGTVTRTMLDEAGTHVRFSDVPGETVGFSLDALSPLERARSNSEAPMASDQNLRTVWSAASASQLAWEDREGGVFTNAFMQGYAERRADRNLNGRITNAELLSYVRGVTERWCANSERCRELNIGFTPDFRGPIEAEAGLPAVPIADQFETEELIGADAAPVVPAETLELAGAELTETDTVIFEEVVQQVTPELETDGTDLIEIVAPIFPDLSALEAMAPVESIEQSSPNEQAFAIAVLNDLFSSENEAQLRIELNTGSELQIGDIVSFTIHSNSAGQVVLLDLNPEGELYQIFPSPLSAPNVTGIEAGGRLVIPERASVNNVPLQIRVVEPAGRGQLLALLVQDEHADALAGLLPPDVAPGPIADGETVLFNLADALNRVQSNEEGNSLISWSAAYVDYNIR